MFKSGTASGLIAATAACNKFDVDSRLDSSFCSFVDNCNSSDSFANASACLGGLRGAPPPISG